MKTYQNFRTGSSLEDDFQVISASYILSSVNLKAQSVLSAPLSAPNPQYSILPHKNSPENPSQSSANSQAFEKLFKPGCGHKECVHCEYEADTGDKLKATHATKPENLKQLSRKSVLLENTAKLQNQNPPDIAPKLPPKPPRLKLPLPPSPAVTISNRDILAVSDISVSSDGSEQETVIYSKNVKIERKISHSNTTSKSIEDFDSESNQSKAKLNGSLQSGQTLADCSTDLETLKIQRYLKEMENEKCSLQEKIEGFDKQLEILGDRLTTVANVSEIEKYKVNNKDVEKITALLYSLASRLAKYENELENEKASGCEKFEMTKKQEKLKSQLSEAKTLKFLIDKRTFLVVGYLEQYFSGDTVEGFKQILYDKTSSIVELKQLEEKLHLSSKELSSLKES